MSVIVWMLMAALASWLAGFLSHRRRWDIILGLIGSVVVSWIFQSQWASPDPGLVGAILVAAVGATSLIVGRTCLARARHMDGYIPARCAGVRPTSRS